MGDDAAGEKREEVEVEEAVPSSSASPTDEGAEGGAGGVEDAVLKVNTTVTASNVPTVGRYKFTHMLESAWFLTLEPVK
jgi:hypothetical protein